MDLIDFPEKTVDIAKDQDEYMTMPAHIAQDGTVTCCWKLSREEIRQVVETGEIWHQILTFGGPLQPQLLLTYKPEMGEPSEG